MKTKIFIYFFISKFLKKTKTNNIWLVNVWQEIVICTMPNTREGMTVCGLQVKTVIKGALQIEIKPV